MWPVIRLWSYNREMNIQVCLCKPDATASLWSKPGSRLTSRSPCKHSGWVSLHWVASADKKRKERESSRTLRPPVATERNILMFKRPLKELPRWRIKIKSRLVLKLIYNPPFAEKASWKYMRRWPRRFGGWFHLEPYFLSTASQDIIQNIWQDNKAPASKPPLGEGWCDVAGSERSAVYFLASVGTGTASLTPAAHFHGTWPIQQKKNSHPVWVRAPGL